MNLKGLLIGVTGIAATASAWTPLIQRDEGPEHGGMEQSWTYLVQVAGSWGSARADTGSIQTEDPMANQIASAPVFDISNFSNANLEEIYPEVDPALGEELQPGEVEAAAGLIATLVEKVVADYPPGQARRDAHPKAHGCVTATMQFESDLPIELAGGAIQPGATHEALVRFSNGSPDPTSSDAKGDTRGMAVKLFDVPGEKLFADPGDPNTQDFIMISSPSFFINSAENYTKFFEAVNSGKISKMAAIPLYLGVTGSMHAVKMLRQKIANPLETRYWSVVPYQLGTDADRQAVKFSARPIGPTQSRIPDNPAPDFLRQAMAQTLSSGPYQMEFLIQRRADTGLSVEDSVPEWPESKAPFQRVGVITIHQQEFDTPERDAYCENQSFNPWHSLAAHRPLGMISRTRRVVYQAIAELRHQMNDASYPTGLPANESGIK